MIHHLRKNYHYVLIEHECGKKLNCENVNTGYSWSNNIVIYRSEELLKLII